MDLELADKTVIVTGAGRGIGLAITRAFIAEGAHVVAGSLSVTPDLQELAGQGAVTALAVDLATPHGPVELIEAAGERIDVLVNNVGIAPPRLDGFLAVTDAMWQATWELDLMAAVRATRAVLPTMLRAGDGAIVNVASLNARLPDPLVVDYSAAKAALVSMAKSVSKEYAGRGIRVNNVDPGPVATDLWLGAGGVAAQVSAATGETPDAVAQGAAAGMVTGRFTRPNEVADLVVLLSSRRVTNLTGSDVVIDGGMVATA